MSDILIVDDERDIRELDMRAAPYDLRTLGYEPVRVETAEGKQEYAAAQRAFAERAGRLRSRLITECEQLLARLDSLAVDAESGSFAGLLASMGAGVAQRVATWPR